MGTDLGRPRDPRIDQAVLDTTAALVAELGYAALTVAAVAERSGTSKPAIYRRWPSKAQLVHEAAFPLGPATELPDTGSLAGDVREMVRRTVTLFSGPAARAALPGLVAEFAADPGLHAALLQRFDGALGGGLAALLGAAAERGEIRPDVDARLLVEALAGTTVMALLLGTDPLDDRWVDRTAHLITRGIAS